jgi:5-methylcytosine-specific restriction protein B
MLKYPENEFNETHRLAKKIDRNWSSVVLPDELKTKFCSAWKKYSKHNAEAANGQVRLFTSSDKFEIIPDSNIAKSICAYPLHQELHSIKKAVQQLASDNGINSFREEFKATAKAPPASWNKWKEALENSDYNTAERETLTHFLVGSKDFYGIKGIARDDFATPAITHAIGVRTDRLSIADQIAAATTPEIYNDCVGFIDQLGHIVSIDKLNHAFSTVCNFCAEYEERDQPIKTSDPECIVASGALGNLADQLWKDFSSYRGVRFEIKYSKGSGNFPRVPWVGLMPPNQSPKSGVYFSLCFGREGNGAVAGFSESVASAGTLNTADRTQQALHINVNGGDPKQHYNNTYENPLELKKENFRYDLLKAHIKESLDRAIDFLNVKIITPAKPVEVLQSFDLCVNKSGFNFHRDVFSGFFTALISKPFTILTGASGTGKTKIAELLSHHLSDEAESSYAIVPVGADWTDNRNVLGFVNHLRDDGSGTEQPIFQSTKVLDLLLNADQNPNYPHFLILDEMNLSHVERYFSDFLSVMEQNNGELKLHSEGDRKLRRFKDDAVKVPQALAYPKNLFVIGTVNIDETTYMFSPKVLDRANVIEFTVSAEDIGAFLTEPKAYQEIEQAKEGIAEGFLDLARKAQDSDWEQLPSAPAKLIADHLLDLFTILKAGRFEFAYRTAKEVNTYLRVCRHLSEDAAAWDGGEWAKNLDDQVLQKLLPKLHGSMSRIGGLLAALANYCHSGEYKAPENHSGASQQNQSRNQLEEASKLIVKDAKFPRSLEKLQAMIHTLRDEQFVSFIQ